MTYQEFCDKYNNKGVDFDGYYGFQCMDLAHQYASECVGHDFAPAPAAKDVWNQNIDGYDKIENTPTGVPTRGDIIIWGTAIGAYGHIAVFDHGDANSFTSFDQNWPLNSVCHYQNHNYTGVLGWFHPQKDVNAIPPQPWELNPNPGYAPTFEGQDVTKDGIHYKSIKNSNGDLIWKIEEGVVDNPPTQENPQETPVTPQINTTTTTNPTVVVKPETPIVETGTGSTNVIMPPQPIEQPVDTEQISFFTALFLWLKNWFNKLRS